ncbi:MAG: hypothetical protein QOG72_3024 [Sphingomonadales bacterium]|jgi:hypothetical protein|nr:hypothetical protein [Sphingomonadales bacterium]
MRRLRGTGLGIAAALVAITAVTPAFADNRLFTFPDPAIVLVRRFAPQMIEMQDNGPAPYAQIVLPTTYPIGTQLRVRGTLAAIGGLGGTVFINGGGDIITLSTSGSFDQTVTLSTATDRLIINGYSYTSAQFTALTVDEVI